MAPTLPGIGNMQGLMHSSGGGGRKGFLGLGGRYPTWDSTYDPITGERRTTTQGFGTTITSPDGFQRMAPQGGMQGFGGLLESGLREQSADRARQEQYRMQMKANEYNHGNAMEQRGEGLMHSRGLNDFQDLLNRRLINSGGRQF